MDSKMEQVLIQVNEEIGRYGKQYVEDMIVHIDQRVVDSKKPASTYLKCLERIVHHREQLSIALNKLINTYERAIAAPLSHADRARIAMLEAMDDKMLRQFSMIYLKDKADDFVLPDERDELIDAAIAAMKDDE